MKRKLPESLQGLPDKHIEEQMIEEGVPVKAAEVTAESCCVCPNCRTQFYVSRLVPYVRCPNPQCRMLLPLWGNRF